MRITIAITLLLALSQLLGCTKTKVSTLDRALQEYNNNQWLMSEIWAKKTIENGTDIHEAQYMMGLCEFQLQQIESSQDWFEKAAASTNTEVNAKATAMLGIIASSKGDHRTAELEFNKAFKGLIGIDKQKAGARTGGVSSTNKFTLQFGAYRDKANATKAIESIATSLQNAGLGNAWITEEKSTIGRTMFLVQAGQFPTRSSASLQRDRTNLPTCIVTASH